MFWSQFSLSLAGTRYPLQAVQGLRIEATLRYESHFINMHHTLSLSVLVEEGNSQVTGQLRWRTHIEQTVEDDLLSLTRGQYWKSLCR